MAFCKSKSLLGCLTQLSPDVLLNNFSKSYPNLSPIANAKTLQHKKTGIEFLKKIRKEIMLAYLSISVIVSVTIFVTFA